jgi:integrase
MLTRYEGSKEEYANEMRSCCRAVVEGPDIVNVADIRAQPVRSDGVTKENKVRKGFFEPDPFSSLYKHLPEHMKPVATFACITGWRRSEILLLQWPQVDFEGRTVRLYTSKNDEGRRTQTPRHHHTLRFPSQSRCQSRESDPRIQTFMGYGLSQGGHTRSAVSRFRAHRRPES